MVIKDLGTGQVTGTLTGTYGFVATITVQPDGIATYSATDACKCTVMGNTGGLLFSELGSGNEATGAFQSKAVITQTAEGLKGVTGTALLTGLQNPFTSLTSGTYTITLSMPSNKQAVAEYSPTPLGTSGSVIASDDSQKSPAPSSTHTEVSPTKSAAAGTSHPEVAHPAPVSSHSDDKHTAATQSPAKPAAPTSNTHTQSSHPHKSP